MNDQGPILERLTRRLAECPADFLREPRAGRAGEVRVDAVVNDLVIELGADGLDDEQAKPFAAPAKDQRNYLGLVLVCSWLLFDEWFRDRRRDAPAALEFLNGREVRELANLVSAPMFVSDPDRREELVRLVLAGLALRPAGESEAQAQDRLETLSSVIRARVVRDTREKQERARKLRQAMEEKKAREAAAKYNRE